VTDNEDGGGAVDEPVHQKCVHPFSENPAPRTSCIVTGSSRACAMTFAVALAARRWARQHRHRLLPASLRSSSSCAAMNCACRNPPLPAGNRSLAPLATRFRVFRPKQHEPHRQVLLSHQIRFCTRTFPEEPNCAVPSLLWSIVHRALTRLRIAAGNRQSSVDVFRWLCLPNE